MAICTACGAQISDKRVFCERCGEAQAQDQLISNDSPWAESPLKSYYQPPDIPDDLASQHEQRQPYEPAPPVFASFHPGAAAAPVPDFPSLYPDAAAPAKEEPAPSFRPPAASDSYAPVSTWRFFGALLLFSVPVVGWVFVVVWACGAVRNRHLCHLARAVLLLAAVAAVCSALLYLLMGSTLTNILQRAAVR